MKKYHYITFIAVFAIICLQTDYLVKLYNNHKTKCIAQCQETLQISLDKELHLRRSKSNTISFKFMEDMTPQEKDSLMRITKPGDTIDIDQAQELGIGKTIGEIYSQIAQDNDMRHGITLNLQTTDSLYTALSPNDFPHSILLYDKDKLQIDSVGYIKETPLVYTSELFPIGTKGLQYIQIKVHIPISDFIEHQILTLSLSVCLMLIALLCLAYQLTEIKRKNQLLLKREASVNGTIHDLKTPLNSVITTLSWLKMTEQDPKKKELLQDNQASVKSLVCQIEGLLINARKDRQKIILHKTLTDIHALAEEVKQDLSLLYQGKSHSITIANHLPDNFRISADEMYIGNVIRNLIENSLKYSDNGVAILITLQTVKNKLQVDIKDNGWGIARNYQKKLFTQFYQVPRNKEQMQRGYGIGLVQVKHIINEHGGDIKVCSSENMGSTFTFTLPLKE